MKQIGFSYKGQHSHDKGLFVTNVARPLLPTVTSKTMTIPEGQGVLYFGYQYEPLELIVDIAFEGEKASDVQGVRRELADWLSPEEGLQALIFDDEPDKKYKAVLNDTSELEQIVTMGQGTLQFLIPEPFAYAVEDDIFIFEKEGTFNIERQGTAHSYPMIEIMGSCTPSDEIEVNINDHVLSFSGRLQEEDTLVLDSQLITAKIIRANDTVESAINQLSTLAFPKTVPGQNTLEVWTTGNAILRQLKITCRSRWK
ncbi:distal tail protein Dit [Caldalkalibacillus salinus]|uniref:distal tail protein Dit n=1 Tax=Caldalkalibacillus salinus TaxID=2803787 RepID=UPI00192295F9|nr:distal tail protein Dit [Caldalkalibacillus salinus]